MTEIYRTPVNLTSSCFCSALRLAVVFAARGDPEMKVEVGVAMATVVVCTGDTCNTNKALYVTIKHVTAGASAPEGTQYEMKRSMLLK